MQLLSNTWEMPVFGLPIFDCNGVHFSALPVWRWADSSGSGVYMFVRRECNATRTILYVGETSNFAARLGPTHEHWAEAVHEGMNEVHFHFLANSRAERLRIETMVRNSYDPLLNRQGLGMLAELLTDRHRPSAGIGLGGGLLPRAGAFGPAKLGRGLLEQGALGAPLGRQPMGAFAGLGRRV